jgi:hypothetical protein
MSVRLKLSYIRRAGRRQQDPREGGEEQGGPAFRECEFEILYGVGVSAAGEIVDLASEAGLIEKSGAYYAWNGERIAQGRDKAASISGSIRNWPPSCATSWSHFARRRTRDWGRRFPQRATKARLLSERGIL